MRSNELLLANLPPYNSNVLNRSKSWKILHGMSKNCQDLGVSSSFAILSDEYRSEMVLK